MSFLFGINQFLGPVFDYLVIRSDEGLKLETSALKLFTVANSHYQLRR